MNDFTIRFKKEGENIVSQLKEELKTIRTGRANPSLVENILVETYGGQTTLKLYELATITTEGPQTLVIQPFDLSTIKDIEKAILKTPLNLSPKNQSNRLIINLPPLSEEQRQKYIKLLNQIVEEKKNRIRSLRDDIRKKIRQLLQEKQISEDKKFFIEKEIDRINQELNNQIDLIKESKRKEILTV